MAERVQKVLARLGYGSRRQIEQWMREGRIRVNDAPAKPGDTLSPRDTVTLDGRRLESARATPACRVLMYNKPEGEICTRSDPQGRPSIFRRFPSLQNGRWVAVGRLDINTTGLILATTDGELANRLMHPSRRIEREYVVRVRGEVEAEALDRLRAGVELEDGPAAFAAVHELGGRGSNRWYGVVLNEGRKREVRRLWEAVGLQVSRLKRVRFGPVSLPSHLRQGQFVELDAATVTALKAAAGLGTETRERGGARRGR
jgi:23S rRNA pseudouridine2605 synthase